MSLSRPVLWPGELFFSVIFCNQRSLIALGHVARNPPSPHPIDIKNSYVMLKLQNYFFIISAYVHVKIISLSLLFTLSFKSFFSVNPIISRPIPCLMPKQKNRLILHKKIQKSKAYIVSLDPSMGTGGDYGAIQVYELPTMTQVAEWQHNSTPIQGQVRILKTIIDKIPATERALHFSHK